MFLTTSSLPRKTCFHRSSTVFYCVWNWRREKNSPFTSCKSLLLSFFISFFQNWTVVLPHRVFFTGREEDKERSSLSRITFLAWQLFLLLRQKRVLFLFFSDFFHYFSVFSSRVRLWFPFLLLVLSSNLFCLLLYSYSTNHVIMIIMTLIRCSFSPIQSYSVMLLHVILFRISFVFLLVHFQDKKARDSRCRWKEKLCLFLLMLILWILLKSHSCARICSHLLVTQILLHTPWQRIRETVEERVATFYTFYNRNNCLNSIIEKRLFVIIPYLFDFLSEKNTQILHHFWISKKKERKSWPEGMKRETHEKKNFLSCIHFLSWCSPLMNLLRNTSSLFWYFVSPERKLCESVCLYILDSCIHTILWKSHASFSRKWCKKSVLQERRTFRSRPSWMRSLETWTLFPETLICFETTSQVIIILLFQRGCCFSVISLFFFVYEFFEQDLHLNTYLSCLHGKSHFCRFSRWEESALTEGADLGLH